MEINLLHIDKTDLDSDSGIDFSGAIVSVVTPATVLR